MRQAIIWIIALPIYWRIYARLREDGLIRPIDSVIKTYKRTQNETEENNEDIILIYVKLFFIRPVQARDGQWLRIAETIIQIIWSPCLFIIY